MDYSIIIVTQNRTSLLRKCLLSIKSATNSFDSIETIVVVNESTNSNYEQIQKEFSRFKFNFISSTSPASARNVGINFCKADKFIFFDDDIQCPESYFQTLKSLNVDWDNTNIIGGPDSPYPNIGPWESSINIAIKSPLATANTRHRHTSGHKDFYCLRECNEQFLSLCNMIIHRRVFSNYNIKFNESYMRCEEIILLNQLKEFPGKILYASNLCVHHKRRTNLFSPVLNSARCRIRLMFEYPQNISFVYFVPMLFVLYLLSFVIVQHQFFKLPLILYLILNITLSVIISAKESKITLVPLVCLIQFFINICYGAGFLFEILIPYKDSSR